MNSMRGTRDLARRSSSKTRLTHVEKELMELRIDLGWAERQRQWVINVELIDLLIKPWVKKGPERRMETATQLLNPILIGQMNTMEGQML